MCLNTSHWVKSLLIALTVTPLVFGAVTANPGLAGSGTAGEPGILSVQPGELNFGTVEVGDTAVMTVTVANAAGAGALTLDALELGSGGVLDPSTSMASLTPEGGQWGDHTRFAHITPDGRYVLFPGATAENATAQLYRHDLWTGTVEMASANTEGDAVTVFGAADDFAISSNGRYVAFKWNGGGLSTPPVPNGTPGFYIRDMDAGVTEFIDIPTTDGELPNHWPSQIDISSDFRLVAFTSRATNLVSGVELPGHPDSPDGPYRNLYIYDHDVETVELVSVAFDDDGMAADANVWNPVITTDGRYVAFHAEASNLIPDDTNGKQDVFVHDREIGITERVSVASDSSEGNDHVTVSGGHFPAINADGRYVAFSSMASNLVPEDTNGRSDVFIRDRVTGTTERVSVASDGSQSLGATLNPAITPDGRYVAFVGSSEAANLVPGDTNGSGDHFIHDRATGITERVSVATDGTEGNKHSFADRPGISADGRFVTFASNATNLVPVDTNNHVDIFVHDRGGAALATMLTITGGDCEVGTVLKPGDGCTVEITFSPDSAGTFMETLVVTTDDKQSVSVMLHGNAPRGPVLAFNPLSLDLGEVPVGATSAPQNATLTNTGDRDATGLAFTASGGGDFFDVGTTDCGSTLPVGENCQVAITFTPLGNGLTFAALKAESDEGAAARLNLAGEGDPGSGDLELIFEDSYEQEDGP